MVQVEHIHMIYLKLCVCVYLYGCVFCVCVCLRRSEDDVRTPGAEVAGCELHDMDADN